MDIPINKTLATKFRSRQTCGGVRPRRSHHTPHEDTDMDVDMDVTEITARLYAIGSAILDKTDEGPWIWPTLKIRDNACWIELYRALQTGVNGGKDHIGTGKGDTPEAALDDADRIVAALPDLENAKLHRHMARVADCIDSAHSDGIDDEYVTPLRLTVKAMSDNLLAGPVAK